MHVNAFESVNCRIIITISPMANIQTLVPPGQTFTADDRIYMFITNLELICSDIHFALLFCQ